MPLLVVDAGGEVQHRRLLRRFIQPTGQGSALISSTCGYGGSSSFHAPEMLKSATCKPSTT